MWTAPVAQEVFAVRSDRLHPYVRPVDAVGLDRWPRWFPRREFQTTTRPVLGQWVPRVVSHLGSIDPAIYSSCNAGSAGEVNSPGLADLLSSERRCTEHPRTVV